MLGQIPKSSLDRQIANRSVIDESWHRPAPRAAVKAAISQQSSYHRSAVSPTLKGRLFPRTLYTSGLVTRQGGDRQALAMHAAPSSASNGATTSQAIETPAEPALTSAGRLKGKLSPAPASVTLHQSTMEFCPDNGRIVLQIHHSTVAPKLLQVLGGGSELSLPEAGFNGHCWCLWDKTCLGACSALKLLRRWRDAGSRQRPGPGIQQPGSRHVQHRHRGGPAPGAEGHADLPPSAPAAEGRLGGEGWRRSQSCPAGRSGRLQRETRRAMS